MFLKVVQRNGAGENIALHGVATDSPQKVHLLGQLDALGHSGQVQGVGHADHAFDHGALTGRSLGVAEELHVQLEHVEVDVFQQVQGGIARAEVVHGPAEAATGQPGHDFAEQGKILDRKAFGALQFQHARGDGVALPHGGVALKKVFLPQAHA